MFDVWKNVLEEVEQSLPPSAFATWFKDVGLVSVSGGIVTIKAPNIFKVGQIQKKYDSVIREALTHNNVPFSDVKYIVASETTVKPKSREVRLDDITKVVKQKNKPLQSETPTVKKFESNLKADYTMDNFVVCSNNNLAAAVAKAVIDNPGKKYNPCYFYGSPGLGKTHLVQAIGNELIKRNPKLKVLYMETKDFYSEYIYMIRHQQGEVFTKKYASVDVLIIDDIQTIAGKERSQEAFFDIFNDMYQKDKQIIITCDRLPEQIETLDARLSSRLASKGAYDLQLPTFEDKCAILKAKAEYDGIEIEDEAIEYIANIVKTNVRDLEREYSKILTLAELRGVTPIEIIGGGYSNTVSDNRKANLTPKKVIDIVAKACNITPADLCSRSRVANIAQARQIAMYLMAEELNLSTPVTAKEVGLKDHTTAMHGIKKIKNNLATDFVLREQVANIRELLYV